LSFDVINIWETIKRLIKMLISANISPESGKRKKEGYSNFLANRESTEETCVAQNPCNADMQTWTV